MQNNQSASGKLLSLLKDSPDRKIDLQDQVIIDKFLELREMGTPERPKHRLILKWYDIDEIVLDEATCLEAKYNLTRAMLLDLIDEARNSNVRT